MNDALLWFGGTGTIWRDHADDVPCFVISRRNLVKKLVGLSIFQTSVFLFYISVGKVAGGTAPIITGDPDTLYSNPLPHVLILTAIVVGVATTALLALVLRVHAAFGSIEEDEVLAMKAEDGLLCCVGGRWGGW